MDTGKEICSFLEKKLSLFKLYLSITKQLKETFRNREEHNLEILLFRRQDCIIKIEGIDRSINKIIKPSSDKLSHSSGRVKATIDSYFKDIQGIMEKVDIIDRELLAMIKEETESIKTGLLKMRDVRRAFQGYNNDKSHSPRFLDTVR